MGGGVASWGEDIVSFITFGTHLNNVSSEKYVIIYINLPICVVIMKTLIKEMPAKVFSSTSASWRVMGI